VGTDAEQPSKRLVEQRIRNRVIEYLELAASFEEQQQYERNVPIAYVPGEVIDQWGDNFPRGLERDLPRVGIFSADEIAALREVEPTWVAACRAMPDDYPTLPAVQALPAWEALRDAASSALAVFEQRGGLSEDEEVP
jgi:hypothetical protein